MHVMHIHLPHSMYIIISVHKGRDGWMDGWWMMDPDFSNLPSGRDPQPTPNPDRDAVKPTTFDQHIIFPQSNLSSAFSEQAEAVALLYNSNPTILLYIITFTYTHFHLSLSPYSNSKWLLQFQVEAAASTLVLLLIIPPLFIITNTNPPPSQIYIWLLLLLSFIFLQLVNMMLMKKKKNVH